MTRHFQKELIKIKKMILSLGAVVEERVQMAKTAIDGRDAQMARRIIKQDFEIDEMEVEVEEECLKVLALHQPVAVDLRFLIAVIKINNDLERVGDLAVNIAQEAARLRDCAEADMAIDVDLPGMATKTRVMLKKSLDALVNLDTELAREVRTSDDEVDSIDHQMYEKVQTGIRSKPEQAASLIHLFSISRNLERIADHATNIAEDVIYMVEGEIVRHPRQR